MVPIDVVSQHQQINRSSSTPRDQFKETFQLAKTIWSQEGVLDAVFYRTDPLLYHKFGNMVFFPSVNLYIHFVAQEH